MADGVMAASLPRPTLAISSRPAGEGLEGAATDVLARRRRSAGMIRCR
jgi:hypothetical protein